MFSDSSGANRQQHQGARCQTYKHRDLLSMQPRTSPSTPSLPLLLLLLLIIKYTGVR